MAVQPTEPIVQVVIAGHFHCDNCTWIWVAARPRATSGQEGSRA